MQRLIYCATLHVLGNYKQHQHLGNKSYFLESANCKSSQDAGAVGSSIALFKYALIARRRLGNHNDTILGIRCKMCVLCHCCVRSVEAKCFVFISSVLFQISFGTDMMKYALRLQNISLCSSFPESSIHCSSFPESSMHTLQNHNSEAFPPTITD